MKRIPPGAGVFPSFITFVPLFVCLAALSSPTIRAADAYFHVSVSSLKLTEGTLPSDDSPDNPRAWQFMPAIAPYAVLDGAGEVYISPKLQPWERRNNAPDQSISIC